jgi:PAS domain S-box-containing protein
MDICHWCEEKLFPYHEKKSGNILPFDFHKLLVAIDSLTELVAYQNRERRIIFANRAVAESFGMKPEEITGKICYEVFHNTDRLCDECPVEKAQQTGKIHTKEMISPDGRYWIIKGIPVKDEHDFVTGVIEVTSDITEQKLLQINLKEIEERWRFALEGSGDGVWDWNMLTDDVFFSDVWKDMLGYSPEDIPNRREEWGKLVHPDDKKHVYKTLQNYLDGIIPFFQSEYRMLCKDGSFKWILDRGKIVSRNDDGKPLRMIGTHTDISALKKSEEERKIFDEKMQYMQKLDSLSKMAGGIAHDFNNLLAIILSSADLSLMDVPPDTSIYENLELILEACERAKKLTDQMLAFTGRVMSELKPVNINNLIIEMKQLIEASISKKIMLKFNLHPYLQDIDGDVSQISQLFMNIISNASEAINDNPGKITITTGVKHFTREYLSDIWIDTQLPEGEYVFLEVSDTGCGINKETKMKIFDPFFSTKFTGRGLGLPAVLGIVRKHNGTIKVNSKDGEYTIFTVLFPPSSSSQDYKPVKPELVFKESFAGNILLVDDEKDYLNLGKRFLEKIGFNVFTAENGRDALNIFRDNYDKIRCVLLDLTMPELNGLQTFSEMKVIKNDVPIIILSGYNEENVLDIFKDKNISAFIQKPYKLKSLSEKIKEAINL